MILAAIRPELSEMLFGRIAVSLVRFLFGGMVAEPKLFAVHGDLGSVFFISSMKCHPLEPRFVVNMNAAVLRVFSSCRFPKVVQSVTGRLTATMVDFKRLFIGCQFPDDPMNEKPAPIQADLRPIVFQSPSTYPSGKSGVPGFPGGFGLEMGDRSVPPCKRASFRVKGKAFAQISRIWQRFWCHEFLPGEFFITFGVGA